MNTPHSNSSLDGGITFAFDGTAVAGEIVASDGFGAFDGAPVVGEGIGASDGLAVGTADGGPAMFEIKVYAAPKSGRGPIKPVSPAGCGCPVDTNICARTI